ncbi:MAG: PEP-CTERM sorting domain-containing protein [Desulfobacterales bacterium]|nr:PEP-CTERM sorting domain-containing protein [Desulfobacterales bacterium]
MRKILLMLIVTLLIMAGSGPVVHAALSWQTEPKLGYGVSYNGDVLVDTGSAGTITIPHYSISGDPLEGVGGPGVTNFSGGTTGVYSGSGVNLTPGDIYTYQGIYTFLGTGAFTVAASTTSFSSTDSFVMLMTGIEYPSGLAAGDWTYSERWSNNANPTNDKLSKVVAFNVSPVPEPAAMLLFGAGLVGLATVRKKFKK